MTEPMDQRKHLYDSWEILEPENRECPPNCPHCKAAADSWAEPIKGGSMPEINDKKLVMDQREDLYAAEKEAAARVLGFLRGIDWSTSNENWKRDRVAEIIGELRSQPVLRCSKCNGTLIYKRTNEGFIVYEDSCGRKAQSAPKPLPQMQANNKRTGTLHAETHEQTLACHAPPRCKSDSQSEISRLTDRVRSVKEESAK